MKRAAPCRGRTDNGSRRATGARNHPPCEGEGRTIHQEERGALPSHPPLGAGKGERPLPRGQWEGRARRCNGCCQLAGARRFSRSATGERKKRRASASPGLTASRHVLHGLPSGRLGRTGEKQYLRCQPEGADARKLPAPQERQRVSAFRDNPGTGSKTEL